MANSLEPSKLNMYQIAIPHTDVAQTGVENESLK